MNVFSMKILEMNESPQKTFPKFTKFSRKLLKIYF